MRIPDLMIVDNFYEDPIRVRKAALAARYKPTSGSLYSCLCAPADKSSVEQGLLRICELAGSEWRKGFSASYFVCGTAADEQVTRGNRRWIHFDEEPMIGLVYLSLPEHCQGGTAFYRLKNGSIATMEEARRHCEKMSCDMQAFLDQGADPELWVEDGIAEMRFNRLILFNPHRFHQSMGHFGDSLENARVFQQFVFNDPANNG